MKLTKLFIQAGSLIVLFLVLIISTSITGCGTIKSIASQFDARIGETIRTMDNAIGALAQQSANWQVVVANLEKEISKDVQSTIRTEIHDLARSAVLSTGAEVRCNVEFMRIKIRRELIDLRNSLAISLNAEIAKSPFNNYQINLIPTEPIRPFICDIVPAAIDMSLEPERRTKIDIYGFDLRSLPISASYKTIGLFKANTLEGTSDFLNSMLNRKYPVKTIVEAKETQIMDVNVRAVPVVDKALKREDIHTKSFDLIAPWRLYDYNISQCISVISDFHAVLDLAGSCANIPPNTKEIILSWDNRIQAEIPILTHEKVLECRTWDSTTVFNDLVFVPRKLSDGDAEFDGNGPCISFAITLSIDPSRKVLSAVVYMDAWECKSDWSYHRDYTEAEEERSFPLFNITDPDMVIVGFDLEPNWTDMYRDTDTSDDPRGCGSAAPAKEIVFIGDTNGDEAGNATKAVIKFNTIKIHLQKCEYK